MIIQESVVDLTVKNSQMRTYVYRPKQDGVYPSIIFYSEIFQQTQPIKRTATILASHGFVVLVPEVFHELNPIGTVLAYDEGKEKGNNDKFSKSVSAYDDDVNVMLDYLKTQPYASDAVGTMGVCIGGHLAFRAALNDRIKSAACLYPTDLHSNTLPATEGQNTLSRAKDIKGELLVIWGKQDPHIPLEGRLQVYTALTEAEVSFTWHEFNAQHAFMRDEGERYDPELALLCYKMCVDLFKRTLV